MQINVHTTCTEDVLKKFNKSYVKDNTVMRCGCILLDIVSILMLFCVFTAVINKSISFSFVINELTYFFVYTLIWMTRSGKLMNKHNRILLNANIDYQIDTDNDYVQAITNGELINCIDKYSYNSFCKICENKEFFYLYVRMNQALIIDKNGFENGTYQQFRDILRDKLTKNDKHIKVKFMKE